MQLGFQCVDESTSDGVTSQIAGKHWYVEEVHLVVKHCLLQMEMYLLASGGCLHRTEVACRLLLETHNNQWLTN
jgi:hypothetical protein